MLVANQKYRELLADGRALADALGVASAEGVTDPIDRFFRAHEILRARAAAEGASAPAPREEPAAKETSSPTWGAILGLRDRHAVEAPVAKDTQAAWRSVLAL
jgi:hypothetical protein